MSFSIYCEESLDYSQQLVKADQIKSSDSADFSKIIENLKEHIDELSINQKYYFLYLSGYENAFKGNISKAISLYQHVEQNSNDLQLKYRASLSLVNLYAMRKDWLSGFEYLDTITLNYESIPDLSIRQQGQIVAAYFYKELEQYEMVRIYVNRLLAEDVAGRNLCMVLSLKLDADLHSDKFDSFEEELFSAINICNQVNEKLVVNVLRTFLATYYFSQKDFSKIIDVLEKNYDEILSSNYQILTFETNSILAKTYLKLGNLEKARKFALLAVEKEVTNEVSKFTVSAYKVLSVVERENRSYDEAFAYQDKYIAAKEFLFEQSKAKQLAIESAKHRAKEKDNQIELLNKKNTILQLQNKFSEETANYNRWLIVLLLLSLTILIMWVVYVKRSQKQLKYLAEYDSLTGVCNRAHFNQSAETELNYSSKSDRAASMVLFDLDHFKRINDNFGHPMGDKVLKLATEACKACVRKIDIFGRVGGEEFAILLPGCEQAQAMNIAEECRKKISEIDTEALGIDSPITASFGIAETGTSGYLFKDMVAHADEAMYVAKHRGRNQVVCHS